MSAILPLVGLFLIITKSWKIYKETSIESKLMLWLVIGVEILSEGVKITLAVLVYREKGVIDKKAAFGRSLKRNIKENDEFAY